MKIVVALEKVDWDGVLDLIDTECAEILSETGNIKDPILLEYRALHNAITRQIQEQTEGEPQ